MSKADQKIGLTAEIVASYVAANRVAADQIPEVIKLVFAALSDPEGQHTTAAPATRKPAISIRRSVSPDHIVCLEDGERFKSLKRHLQAKHNLTPQEYRAKWRLPRDYPMVAPNYAETRSAMATQMGLGQSQPIKRRGRNDL